MKAIALLIGWAATFAADDVNRYLYPTDTSMLAVIDLDAMRQSRLFEKELDQGFKALIDSNEQVRNLSRVVGFDPAKELTAFTVCAGQARSRERDSLLILNGRFPYEKLAAALAEQAEKGELTAMTVNDLPVYFNHRARRAVYFALVDHRTLIASPAKQMVENSIQGLTDLREPKDEMKKLLVNDLLPEKAPGNPAVTLAGLFPEQARRQFANAEPLRAIADKLVGYHVLVLLGEPTMVRARLTLSDAAAAQQAVATFNLMVGFGKAALANSDRTDIREMLEKLKFSPKESAIVIEADLPRSLVETMIVRNEADEERMRARRAEAIQKQREAAEKAARAKGDLESKSKEPPNP